jgi:hypothetical protein
VPLDPVPDPEPEPVLGYTAIRMLFENQLGIPSLTKRDAPRMHMTEFFDFDNVLTIT